MKGYCGGKYKGIVFRNTHVHLVEKVIVFPIEGGKK